MNQEPTTQTAQPGAEQPKTASGTATTSNPKDKRTTQKPAATKKPARSDSKQARMIAMLKRESGATIDQLTNALDWQPHSVRGAISGLIKKKLGLKVANKKNPSGVLSYRIR